MVIQPVTRYTEHGNSEDVFVKDCSIRARARARAGAARQCGRREDRSILIASVGKAIFNRWRRNSSASKGTAMEFTKAEIEQWRADRRADRQGGDRRDERPMCGHCHNGFDSGGGVVTDDFSICDVCNGD